MRSRVFSSIAVLSVLALGTACTAFQDGPVAVQSGVPSLAVGDRNSTYTLMPGIVNVCAFFPDLGADPLQTATFSASAPAGGTVITGNFDLKQPPPLCIEVWNATGDALVPVSTTLLATDAKYTIDRVIVASGTGIDDPAFTETVGTNTGSVTASNTIGGYIWFKFKLADVPPAAGGEGCTPGYWRQSHHFDSWVGYSPNQAFSSVFANAFPGKTLGQVVALGGGGINALGRHSVAALLNAASPTVSFDYTAAQVISQFNAAFSSGNARVIEAKKNEFDMLNNQGCPLN